MVLPATPPVVPAVLPLMPVSPVAEVLILRVLKLEEDRWRREGVGWLGPESRWFAFWSVESGRPLDVEEVVDTTEADCWRRIDSSLVRRLT